MKHVLVALAVFCMPKLSNASELQLGASFLFAKEQAKNSSGQSGGALFTDRETALNVSNYWKIDEASDFSFGGFISYEFGNRRSCAYGGLDAQGVPQPSDCRAGKYNQFWIGPSVQWVWRTFFMQASYIIFGTRSDEAYPTLQSPGGSDSSFRTHPFKAWIFTPGLKLEINERTQAFVKIEYRYLYYSKRGGGELSSGQLYGNQSIRPQLGVSFSL